MRGLLILCAMLFVLAVCMPRDSAASTVDANYVTTSLDESSCLANVDAKELDAKNDASVIDEFAIWYPGKNLRAWRANARAGGGWYPGKNLGRVLRGSAGSC